MLRKWLLQCGRTSYDGVFSEPVSARHQISNSFNEHWREERGMVELRVWPGGFLKPRHCLQKYTSDHLIEQRNVRVGNEEWAAGDVTPSTWPAWVNEILRAPLYSMFPFCLQIWYLCFKKKNKQTPKPVSSCGSSPFIHNHSWTDKILYGTFQSTQHLAHLIKMEGN